MRHILMTLAAICMASLTLGTAQAQMGVGYVDVDRMFSESQQGKAALARVRAAQEEWRAKIAVKQEELNKSRADAAAREPMLNDGAKRELAVDLERQSIELIRLQDDARRAITKLEHEELMKIQNLAMPAIEAVRREALLEVVLRRDYVVAADPSRDLTNAVIAKMAEMQ